MNASEREATTARAKEWIGLIQAIELERPRAGRGWATQEAKRRNPALYRAVHGLAESPVNERPRPPYPVSVPGLGAAQTRIRPDTGSPPVAERPAPAKVAKIARGAVPAYLRDRAQRPSPPIMFWVQEAGKWVSVELTAGEQRAIEAGQALPETMSLAEAKRRQASDGRTPEQRSADKIRLGQAWHARHPYSGPGACLCCDHLREQPWYPTDGPDAA